VLKAVVAEFMQQHVAQNKLAQRPETPLDPSGSERTVRLDRSTGVDKAACISKRQATAHDPRGYRLLEKLDPPNRLESPENKPLATDL
jgi:hypothetical protein